MTIPNNSFREDGVQDRFVDLLFAQNVIKVSLYFTLVGQH